MSEHANDEKANPLEALKFNLPNPMVPSPMIDAKTHEDHLYAFAGLAMQKLIMVKPPKKGDGNLQIECDTRAAWEIAETMMKTKERLDSERQ